MTVPSIIIRAAFDFFGGSRTFRGTSRGDQPTVELELTVASRPSLLAQPTVMPGS